MKIFVDTNIWLRFLVKDDLKMFSECKKLIEQMEDGKINPYTSSFVFQEVYYVMNTYYEATKNQIMSAIDAIVKIRNITLIDRFCFKDGWNLFKKSNLKLSDCIILSQIPKKIILCTYDQQLLKQSFVEAFLPMQTLKKLGD